jgi:hypothetical protein
VREHGPARLPAPIAGACRRPRARRGVADEAWQTRRGRRGVAEDAIRFWSQRFPNGYESRPQLAWGLLPRERALADSKRSSLAQ